MNNMQISFFPSLLLLIKTFIIRYQIMLKCWEENPSDRPTFAKLKNTMKEMERNHRVKQLRIQALKLLFSFNLFYILFFLSYLFACLISSLFIFLGIVLVTVSKSGRFSL